MREEKETQGSEKKGGKRKEEIGKEGRMGKR